MGMQKKVPLLVVAAVLLLQTMPMSNKSKALENWCHWPSSRKVPECTGFCGLNAGQKAESFPLSGSMALSVR